MKSLKKSSYFFVLVSTALLSGCGSSGVTATPSTTQGQDNNQQVVVPVDTGSGYGAYPLTFQTVGTSAAVPSAALRTDSLLKVKVTLDPASQNQYPAGSGVYSNYTANYSCATVSVTLQIEQNGTYQNLATVVTDRLTAAGTPGCAGSVGSQTIDFSAYMLPGHGNVKITAQAISSNYNCLTAQAYPLRYPYGYYQNVCSANPMQSIYQYHVVNGKLEVQVNGTTFN
jgi:hypothetical protein